VLRVPGDLYFVQNEQFSRASNFVKFCVKWGKSFMETFEMLKTAFGNEALGRPQTFEWWKRTKHGRTSTDDDLVQADHQYPKLMKLLQKLNRRLTLREIAEEVCISRKVCHEILTQNLGMSRIAAKFVPRFCLTSKNKFELMRVKSF
jgi:hypothetical protein